MVIADSVQEAHEKCEHNTERLKHGLAAAGCALESTKKVVVVARWFGGGGQNQMKEYMKEGTITDGSKKDVARYPGSMATRQQLVYIRYQESRASYANWVLCVLRSVGQHEDSP